MVCSVPSPFYFVVILPVLPPAHEERIGAIFAFAPFLIQSDLRPEEIESFVASCSHHHHHRTNATAEDMKPSGKGTVAEYTWL